MGFNKLNATLWRSFLKCSVCQVISSHTVLLLNIVSNKGTQRTASIDWAECCNLRFTKTYIWAFCYPTDLTTQLRWELLFTQVKRGTIFASHNNSNKKQGERTSEEIGQCSNINLWQSCVSSKPSSSISSLKGQAFVIETTFIFLLLSAPIFNLTDSCNLISIILKPSFMR